MAGQKPQIVTYFVIALVLFVLGRVSTVVFDQEYNQAGDARSIQQSILDKEEILESTLKLLSSVDVHQSHAIWTLMDSLSGSNTLVYLFHQGRVLAWSSSALPLDNYSPQKDALAFEKFANGWYLVKQKSKEDYQWLVLELVKEEYTYQNKFLSNNFADDFFLNYLPSIHLSPGNNPQYNIKNSEGRFLFSLHFNPQDQHIPNTSILIFLLNLLALLLLIIGGLKWFHKYLDHDNSNYLFILAIVYFFGIYLLFKNGVIPEDFIHASLFSPSSFAVSDWLPSLASLLFFGSLMLIISYLFYKHFKSPRALTRLYENRRVYYLSVFAAVFTILIYFLFINDLIYMIVRNSSQASMFYNIEDVNEVSIIKILVLVQLFLAYAFVLEKIISSFHSNLSYIGFFLMSCLCYSILWAASYYLNYDIHHGALVFFLFLASILFNVKRNIKNELTFSTAVLIIFFISAYNTALLYSYNIEKEERNRELLIDNLSFRLLREADPVAEMYLTEIEVKLNNDKELQALLHKTQINEELILDHLKKNYFYGYWQRYDVQITTCWPEVDLVIEDNQHTVNCYNYFDNIIQTYGQIVPNSHNFFFLENDNGQVSYFGRVSFFDDEPEYETSLFFEINSKPTFSGLGYPELLTTEQEQMSYGNLRNYSYAKYINHKLVNQNGTYRYPYTYNFEGRGGEKEFLEEGNISHLVYTPNKETTIVISREKVKLFHILLAFSSFFILFFIVASSIIIFTRLKRNGFKISLSIQEKIQLTFVGLIIGILVIMGISSVFYSLYQFKEKNNQMLSQRIKSVLQEMEQNIVNEAELDIEMQDYLQYLLQKFSNVFYSDINLYDLDGHLLATSRPELYNKGLSGKTMNPNAYIELSERGEAEFIHQETIGSMIYTSAYAPVFNYDNKVLAYLNLPYFVGNNEFKSEVSSLVVAIVNTYLLFVLFAIGLAVVISKRITSPLMLIQDRLAQIKLGQQNKKIGYRGKDEVGNLVKEYNRMVDELSESAEKLAKSQREIAWREMAKQIAHEIKNPLTPMKLSVQYLLRAWNEQKDFESYLNRVSATLIEQIDQLHLIANEFSNFAKMPQASRAKVDVVAKIKSVSSLFEKNEKNIHFQIDIEGENLFIFADNDQLISIFNNIIKNAIQAIPKDKAGNINILIKKESPNVHISISDNGRGMDEATKSRIFTPNFTTKSSGMGLGLSIVKNIVENSGGEIWFDTIENIGTTFYIVFPLYKEV